MSGDKTIQFDPVENKKTINKRNTYESLQFFIRKRL